MGAGRVVTHIFCSEIPTAQVLSQCLRYPATRTQGSISNSNNQGNKQGKGQLFSKRPDKPIS